MNRPPREPGLFWPALWRLALAGAVFVGVYGFCNRFTATRGGGALPFNPAETGVAAYRTKTQARCLVRCCRTCLTHACTAGWRLARRYLNSNDTSLALPIEMKRSARRLCPASSVSTSGWANSMPSGPPGE